MKNAVAVALVAFSFFALACGDDGGGSGGGSGGGFGGGTGGGDAGAGGGSAYDCQPGECQNQAHTPLEVCCLMASPYGCEIRVNSMTFPCDGTSCAAASQNVEDYCATLDPVGDGGAP